MVSNPLKAKTHLNGERKKRNKWLRWLHMTKHERKNWRGSKSDFFMLILGIHVSGKGDTERGRRKGKKKPSKGCYQGRWQRVKIL
jgi:hypothetical protein